MELHIKDRIYIPQILPQTGTFMEFNLKRNIIEKVQITAKDRDDYNIKENKEEGKITWDSAKDQQIPLQVEFSKDELDYLKKACEKLTDTPSPDDLWLTVEKIYNAE